MEILLSISSKTDGKVREIKRDVDGGLVIGRGAEEGILLDGLDLSREHVVLSVAGSEIRVRDVSVNGTWLNGTRLERAVETLMRPTDVIEIPGYALRCRLAAQPADTDEVKVVTLPRPVEQEPHVVTALSAKADASGLLSPVFGIVRSFTVMERLLILVSLSGLLLLATYVGA